MRDFFKNKKGIVNLLVFRNSFTQCMLHHNLTDFTEMFSKSMQRNLKNELSEWESSGSQPYNSK